jgi:Ion channel
MIGKPISARVVLVASVLGLLCSLVIGGALISAADGSGYSEGLWVAFSIVTTVGFGDGPGTGLGRLISATLFIIAAVSWFGVVVVAVEVGLSRFQHIALVREALRPLSQRRGPKLFHDN